MNDEIFKLKKALLMERRERGMLLAQLAEAQLMLLEQEAEQKAEKPEAPTSGAVNA